MKPDENRKPVVRIVIPSWEVTNVERHGGPAIEIDDVEPFSLKDVESREDISQLEEAYAVGHGDEEGTMSVESREESSCVRGGSVDRRADQIVPDDAAVDDEGAGLKLNGVRIVRWKERPYREKGDRSECAVNANNMSELPVIHRRGQGMSVQREKSGVRGIPAYPIEEGSIDNAAEMFLARD